MLLTRPPKQDYRLPVKIKDCSWKKLLLNGVTHCLFDNQATPAFNVTARILKRSRTHEGFSRPAFAVLSGYGIQRRIMSKGHVPAPLDQRGVCVCV